MESGDPRTADEDRLNAILLDYVEAVERGERPDRDGLLAAHPEHADQLRAFLATRDRLDRLATPLRVAAACGSGWGRRRGSESTGSYPLAAIRPAEAAGRVGDFRLLREVGRGGMGVVYEAEQVSLRRRVALKVLPFAAAIDPRHLQRFRNEAQAAAQLHHSNIVPVHAVGAEAGVHFYAMQFIDGLSLAQLVADLRGGPQPAAGGGPAGYSAPTRVAGADPDAAARTPDGPPPGGLPSAAITAEHSARRRDYLRRAADWARQAADALEYAHQAGIVHRDVKPANLLLDATGRLWVTDFGLALIRNDAGLTAPGELVGTVRYMSPEQALGRPGLVDHRTDVFSLGATLYELLTLAPPFGGEDRRTLLRQLADDEPRPPRTVDRAIPAALETVVLKALAKLPADRYASAREFADDLRRYLDDRPVLARRPTPLDRLAKWVRRHRAAAAAGVGVLLVLAVGFAVSTAVVSREHAETKRAYGAEQRANERERQRAEEAQENYRRTRRAVDLFVELSDEELLDFPPLAPFRQRLLEAAVAYYQELTDRRDDPAVRADLNASRARLARLQDELAALNDLNVALLLDQPAVRADVGLRPEQAARLAPLLARLTADRQSPPPDAGGGRRRQIADLAAECRREVEGVLTAAQHRRLRQVFLRVPGPHVFGPAVLDALGLTDAQRPQVRQVLADATQASLRVVVAADTRDEGRGRFEDVWREATARIVALLTPAQRGRWDGMTGPPVDGDVRFPVPTPGRRN